MISFTLGSALASACTCAVGLRKKSRQEDVSRNKGRSEAFLRWLEPPKRSTYKAFEDTEEEASHTKIFLEESALKPVHPSKGKGGNQPWLPSSHPGNPECGKRHCSPGRLNF